MDFKFILQVFLILVGIILAAVGGAVWLTRIQETDTDDNLKDVDPWTDD